MRRHVNTKTNMSDSDNEWTTVEHQATCTTDSDTDNDDKPTNSSECLRADVSDKTPSAKPQMPRARGYRDASWHKMLRIGSPGPTTSQWARRQPRGQRSEAWLEMLERGSPTLQLRSQADHLAAWRNVATSAGKAKRILARATNLGLIKAWDKWHASAMDSSAGSGKVECHRCQQLLTSAIDNDVIILDLSMVCALPPCDAPC